VVVAMMAVSAACSTETTATESRAISTPTTGESPAPTSATTAPTVADAPSDPTDPTDPSDLIDQLAIDDSPRPIRPYVRDDWPHWEDVDGDGCDARQQTLIAQSLTPAQVDPFGCAVVAGDWFSIYDGITSDQPSELDVDHVVALENAHTSGGWQWEADRRRHFANDPDNLLAVSSASNRSKGSSGPQEWRPPRQEAWCEFATRWINTKLRWGLSATRGERDALGQMIDTCGAAVDSTMLPSDGVVPDPQYANCAAARAAGVAPIRRGEPGYAARLDGDNDGIACE
jgi:hypothetical protein